jgi:uncharacterized protein
MENKKTLVIGASTNPERFSYKAIKLLKKHEHLVEAIGAKEGELEGVQIYKTKHIFADIHTVTMYIGPKNQHEYYEYILNLKPKRIIFNPGTANPEFEKMAKDSNIEVVEDCTLVMLNTGNF